jgi:hypothetical protein
MKESLYNLLPSRLYLELKWFDFKINQPEDYKLTQLRRVKDFNGYGFKSFDEKKAIFVHIPKCAGISVCKSLFGNLGGGHNTLEQYTYIFSPKELSSYFKFTFVRNPWDRLVSAYHFLQKGGISNEDKHFFDVHLAKYKDFDDFVINWINKENIMRGLHFRPQWSFIYDKRQKITVDFIGKFEDIDKDFNFVCQKLGVDIIIEKTNVTERRPYQKYYSEETKEIVRNVYQRDIEEFGYIFESR